MEKRTEVMPEVDWQLGEPEPASAAPVPWHATVPPVPHMFHLAPYPVNGSTDLVGYCTCGCWWRVASDIATIAKSFRVHTGRWQA